MVHPAVESDSLAFHRDAHGRVEPVDPMPAGQAGHAHEPAHEPALRRGPILGDRDPREPLAVVALARERRRLRRVLRRRCDAAETRPTAVRGHAGRGQRGGALRVRGTGGQERDRERRAADGREHAMHGGTSGGAHRITVLDSAGARGLRGLHAAAVGRPAGPGADRVAPAPPADGRISCLRDAGDHPGVRRQANSQFNRRQPIPHSRCRRIYEHDD